MINLQYLTTAQTLDVWFTAPDSTSFTVADCTLNKELSGYLLQQQGVSAFVQLKHPEDAEELDFCLTRGVAYLCCIENIAADQSVQVRVVGFSNQTLLLPDLTILQPDLTQRRLTPQLLKDDLTLRCAGRNYVLLLQDDANSAEFTLVGQHYSLTVAVVAVQEQKQAQEVVTSKVLQGIKVSGALPLDRGGVRLCAAEIKFLDLTNKANASSFAAQQLAMLTSAQGSYLRAWDNYSAKEGEWLLQRARSIGAIKYQAAKRLGNDGLKWSLDLEQECPTGLTEGDVVTAQTTLPMYLQQSDLSWEDYFTQKEAAFRQSKQRTAAAAAAMQNGEEQPNNENGERRGVKFSGTVKRIARQQIEIEVTEQLQHIAPPTSGLLLLDADGDLTQMERRLKARRQIKAGKSANPLLGLIIEEDGKLPQARRAESHKIPALTPLVREKIFKHDPTMMQQKAIEIALNTPDIALIQGPPGTGKTTVIAAITERLNELLDPAKVRGSILVSAFQHDAVDNLVSRLSVNSLPAVKFGGRQRQPSEQSEAIINQWRLSLAEKIKAKHPQLQSSLEIRHLHEAFTAYMILPTPQNEEAFLLAAQRLSAGMLTSKTVAKINDGLAQLTSRKLLQAKVRTNELLPWVYGLRETPESYADDGLQSAAAAVLYLSDFLSAEDQALLANCTPHKDSAYFAAVKALKERLLSKLVPEQEQSSPKPQEHIMSLMAAIEAEVNSAQHSEKGVAQAVADFLYSLENNPRGVQEAIKECNTVFAATVQQAEGSDITKAKRRLNTGSSNAGRAVNYDTVIVDEAARASPMDLLIPMAQARQRIILVGDHKQLPHIIDEEIARQLETEAGADAATLEMYYQQSLFAYLFKRLQQLTAADGIERTVTLDAQYRMHPLLGDFVSSHFYNNEVKSPLPAEHFAQQLPATDGKAALWLNVPFSAGPESRSGTSRQRLSEAQAIVQQLKVWLRVPEGKALSFGVISFYKAQQQLIQEVARKEGLLSFSNDGNKELQLNPEYCGDNPAATSERLRINTVDAFQGMEFDVVFLSMVRCHDLQHEHIADATDVKMQRRLYGHLTSSNRLCVALSRQKRLLVVVGDMQMVTGELAAKAVPALHGFLALCQSQGKILDGGLN